jgi:hypothetical protein
MLHLNGQEWVELKVYLVIQELKLVN